LYCCRRWQNNTTGTAACMPTGKSLQYVVEFASINPHHGEIDVMLNWINCTKRVNYFKCAPKRKLFFILKEKLFDMVFYVLQYLL